MDVQLTDRFSTCQKNKTLSICDGTTVSYVHMSNEWIQTSHPLIIASSQRFFVINGQIQAWASDNDLHASINPSLSAKPKSLFIECLCSSLLFSGLSHRRLPINLRLNFHWMWHASLSLSSANGNVIAAFFSAPPLRPRSSQCQFIPFRLEHTLGLFRSPDNLHSFFKGLGVQHKLGKGFPTQTSQCIEPLPLSLCLRHSGLSTLSLFILPNLEAANASLSLRLLIDDTRQHCSLCLFSHTRTHIIA